MPVLPELPDLRMIPFRRLTEMFGKNFDRCVLGVSAEFKLRLSTADVLFKWRNEMPNNLALLPQLRLEYGTRPYGECESGVTKALTLPGPFAMELRAPSVGSNEQNERSDTFIAPALCMLQKLRTGVPDQRFVALLVALAL